MNQGLFFILLLISLIPFSKKFICWSTNNEISTMYIVIGVVNHLLMTMVLFAIIDYSTSKTVNKKLIHTTKICTTIDSGKEKCKIVKEYIEKRYSKFLDRTTEYTTKEREQNGT
jgi:hypothetical protein